MTGSGPGVVRVPGEHGPGIVVHDLGGRGIPVVLAHATGLHGLVWRPLADAVTEHLRCFSFDARRHGDSRPGPGDDHAWPEMARVALAVIDGLGLDQPVGVGHSSGASILLLAEQARPETFRALYCFEPVIVPVHPPLGRDRDNWLAQAARRRREVFASRREAYAHYAAKPPFSTLAPAALAAYVDHGFHDLPDGRVQLKCHREHEALVHEMATDHDAFARLPTVGCPVLVAYGGCSEAWVPALVEAQTAPLPDVTVEVLAGLGHLGPLEDPAAVARSLLRFVAAHGGRRG